MFAITWSTGVENAWSNVAEFVPKLIGFLLILLIGYFVVKVLARLVDALLEKVHFDEAVERGGVARALERSNLDASDIVAKLVFYGLMLIVLQMAFGVFGPNPISDLLEGVIAYIPKVLVALIIVVIAAAIAAAVRELIGVALANLEYGRLLANVTSGAIVTVGVFAALNQLQIAPAIVNGLFYALLAIVAGSAILAIGLGGVQPMRGRWEKAFERYDTEKPRLQEELRNRGSHAVGVTADKARHGAPGSAGGAKGSSSVRDDK